MEELLKKYDKDQTMLDLIKVLEISSKPNTFLYDLQDLITKEATKVFDTEVFRFNVVLYYMHLVRNATLNETR